MKQFSQEFKASVIERIRNGESQMGVAKSLGISCKTVNSWWTKAKQELPQEQLSAEQEIKNLWNPTLCQGVDNNISRLLHF